MKVILRVAVPVSEPLLALKIMGSVSGAVIVPVIVPVVGLIDNPAGKFVAPNRVGSLVAVI